MCSTRVRIVIAHSSARGSVRSSGAPMVIFANFKGTVPEDSFGFCWHSWKDLGWFLDFSDAFNNNICILFAANAKQGLLNYYDRRAFGQSFHIIGKAGHNRRLATTRLIKNEFINQHFRSLDVDR